MKQTRNTLIGIVAATAWLLAGNVGTLTTFTANTTAKASEVNGNFSAVKTAVNGNANDIATNAHDITTNKNSINTVKGDYVSSVTAGTGLTGGGSSGDVTLKPADGYVSINPAAFVTGGTSGTCTTYTGATVFKFNHTGSRNNCDAIASVSLPDHVTITSFECDIKKDNNAASGDLAVRLRYISNDLASHDIIVLTTNDAGRHLLSSSTIEGGGDPVVDNHTKVNYHIHFDPPNNTDTPDGDDNQIYGCHIGYTYN